MRKLLSLLLAVILAFSLVTMASAEPAGEYAGKTVILHSNDVHGAIAGYAYMAALKADYEAKGADVILVDAGDFSQGTTYVSTTKGADAVAMMNAVGYDVVTLGNHEFDYGWAQLKENLSSFSGEVVCADVLESGSTIYDPYAIVGTDVKVAFIGLETPEAQTKVNPALIKGLTFLVESGKKEISACATQYAAEARTAGADVVICLSHLGIDAESVGNQSYDLWNAVKSNPTASKIDFIIDGHSHSVMTEGDNGEPIQSTGTAFANIGVIVIDEATKAIESHSLYEIGEGTAKDDTVAAAAQEIIDRVNAEYGVKFATSDVDLNGAKAPNGNRDSETNNGNLITDSMVWCITKNPESLKSGFDPKNVVAITNGGGIRAAIGAGDVTKQAVNTVLPFGNTVALVYVSGAELLEALEASTYCSPEAVGGFPQVSGINFTLNALKPYDANAETYPGSTYYGPKTIQRVTINSINGNAFDPTAEYAVVTNNFCAAGGDTYYAFAAATEQFDTGLPLDEVLMDYITEELDGTIDSRYAAPKGNITYKTVSVVLSNNGVTKSKTIKCFNDLYTDPDTPERSGYTFDGWFVNGTKVTAANIATLVTDGTTLTAHWARNYDGNTYSDDTAAVSSPKTADAGVVLYVGMGIFSLMGMGYMGKKKEK